ncbi:hypothetical protein HYALB_00011515 [Hymenoscyphus albidus]|uniref:Uncharacterized protein n=1 Tax=Hymenoscyphus albidus TaxID=595503 RepID=A0A9N9LW13_9HELO|nr:hypothetical protein HYALB_00011515 [Hymenoscyphus albidus]
MEWIGNSTNGLRIEDSRRERAENPLAHSQDRNLRKYPAVLVTDQRTFNQKTSTAFDLRTHLHNHPFPLEAIPTSFDREIKLGLESSSPASGSRPPISIDSQQDLSYSLMSDPLSSSSGNSQAQTMSVTDFQAEANSLSLLNFDGVHDFRCTDENSGCSDLGFRDMAFFDSEELLVE